MQKYSTQSVYSRGLLNRDFYFKETNKLKPEASRFLVAFALLPCIRLPVSC